MIWTDVPDANTPARLQGVMASPVRSLLPTPYRW